MNKIELDKIDPSQVNIIIFGNKYNGIVIIDKEDLEKIENTSWYIDNDNNGYKRIKGWATKERAVVLSRFILNVTDPDIIVDHEDRDTFNNRKSNFRLVDKLTNNLNKKMNKRNTSERTGIHIIKGKGTRSARWCAMTWVDGKTKTKTFSIKKYGYNEARNMAIVFRKEWEDKYNVLTEKGQ